MKRNSKRHLVTAVAIFGGALALAGCASSPTKSAKRGKVEVGTEADYGVAASRKVVEDGQPVPKGGGRLQVGKPYQIAGKWYYPKEEADYDKAGVASWYGEGFHGRLTANGEVYDSQALSAAHPTLPLPSYARVTNLSNGKSVMVRINDRGPYHQGRIMDLSDKASDMLGFREKGLARVRVQYVGTARLDGQDDKMLLASYRTAPGEGQIGGDRVMVAQNGGTVPAGAATMVATAKPAAPMPSAQPIRVASLEQPQPVAYLNTARTLDPQPAASARAGAALPPLPKPVSSSAASMSRDAMPAMGGPLVLAPSSRPATTSASSSATEASLPQLAPAPRPLAVAPTLPQSSALAPANATRAASTAPGGWRPQALGASSTPAPLKPIAANGPASAAPMTLKPVQIAPVKAPAYVPPANGVRPLLPPIRSTTDSYAPTRVSAGHMAIEHALASGGSVGALVAALEARKATAAH